MASLGDGPSFRLPVPTGQGQETEVAAIAGVPTLVVGPTGKRSDSSGTNDDAVVIG